jgi:LPXTG-site transpeptidase (sortase) family protein
VTGKPPVGSNVSAPGEHTSPTFISVPKIGLAKRVVDTPTKVSPGVWDVTYELLVHNYGNVTLDNIQVTDNLDLTFPAPTTYSVRSITSSDFTVNSNFNGHTKLDLIDSSKNTKTLAFGKESKLNLIVRITPSTPGPFDNTATVTADSPGDTHVTDISQDGVDPDPDADNNPGNNNVVTPVDFSPHFFDPPFGEKTLDSNGYPIFRYTMVWINDTNILAINAQVSDGIPEGTAFIDDGIITSGILPPNPFPEGSVASGVSCTDTSLSTTTTYCYYEGPTSSYPRGRIIWRGVLGPDPGITNPALAQNAISITFSITNLGVGRVDNVAMIDSDLNGDGVIDSSEERVASASKTWQAEGDEEDEDLPNTGFIVGRETYLPIQPIEKTYNQYRDLWMEIPSIGTRMTIVGVPKIQDGWDVTWLGDNAGYLEGTAFPTWSGNSVITGHIYGADGQPGPFVNLEKLKWGERIIIHGYGQKYIYEVRSVNVTGPDDRSAFQHEDLPWLTLVTCKDYDETAKTYKYRIVVKAVQVKVE